MSYQTFPLTPEFSWVETYRFETLMTEFESGDIQLRAKWPKARRRWALRWNHATPSEAEQLRAFARDMVGAATPFWYQTADKIPRPYSAPVASQVSGGSLPQGAIRYCAFTWGDVGTSTETTISVNSDSLTPSPNYLLTVTVPDFPPNVDVAWVYVSYDPNDLKKQTTGIGTSGGTWTEPVTGYDTGGASPPTTNALSETVLVHFASDDIRVEKGFATWYSMAVEFEELFE